MIKLFRNFADWVRLYFWDRFDVVKAKNLKRGRYYDKDWQMMSVCFQLLVDYVEVEADQINWKEEPYAGIWKEMQELYSWWTKDRKIREEKGDSMLLSTSWDKEFSKEERENWFKFDIACGEEDTEMLIRLMKIRPHLWS